MRDRCQECKSSRCACVVSPHFVRITGSGRIPRELGALNNLETLSLSSNKLSGEIEIKADVGGVGRVLLKRCVLSSRERRHRVIFKASAGHGCHWFDLLHFTVTPPTNWHPSEGSTFYDEPFFVAV